MPEAHRTCIGCHELLHVQRRDWLTVLGEQVLSVLWFHPAVLILIRRIELSREQLVDCEVASDQQPQGHLNALVAMARHDCGQPPFRPFLSTQRPGRTGRLLARRPRHETRC
jgi:hypothetical protein